MEQENKTSNKIQNIILIIMIIITIIILYITITLCAIFTKEKHPSKNVVKEPKDFELKQKNKRVKLNSEYYIPINGIGIYSLDYYTCINSIETSLSKGVRLIDIDNIYGNKDCVQRAIYYSGISRDEIFIIAKIYPDQYSNPGKDIESFLNRTNFEYIDLMLLSHPGKNDVKAYLIMEEYIKNHTMIRSLGLSNWYIKELKHFLRKITIIPAIIQNEIHPYYQETDFINYIYNDLKDKNIIVQGWYPLGGKGYNSELMQDEVLINIGKKYHKTLPQVILRWHLQRGTIVIPGSSNTQHIIENNDIYDFELSDEDMKNIANLNRDEKHGWY
jgi:diketogulonate reductase-like aldo/keto reductase